VTSPQPDEFFIGYAPPMPQRLATFVRRVVKVLAIGVLPSAAVVGAGHVGLDAGTFEFGHPKGFTGAIVEQPYPGLRLDGDRSSADSIPLLVAPGKHGAETLVRGLHGRHVVLTGTRIERNGHLMIEVQSIEPDGQADAVAFLSVDTKDWSGSEQIQLTGEVVDSKCFLGVMVPGSGKTHKECASLCIRGGIPPALFVQDSLGQSALLLLTGSRGESVAAHATLVAGEAITLIGTVHRENGWLVLRTDPASWIPVAR
jgi:hypothetical protein